MGVLCKCFVKLFVLLWCYVIVTEAEPYGPFITLSDGLSRKNETVVDSKGTLILTCEGSKPLMWTYPNNTVESDLWDTVTIQRAHFEYDEFPFKTRLELSNASYVNTGFYYCHEENVIDYENTNRDGSTKIYVYVRDEVHLGLLDSKAPIIIHQYEKGIIPCRPTSPDVEVKLYKEGDDEADAIVKHYDPKYGFTIQANELTDSGDYICLFNTTHNNHVEQIYSVIVMIKSNGVEKPVIIDIKDDHTIVGEKLELLCSVSVEDGIRFNINWNVPCEDGIKDNRIKISKAVRVGDDFGESTLIIEKALKEDQGHYTCTVEDHSRNKNSTTSYIKIHDVDESYIDFNETNNDFNLTVKSGENVSWSINFKAHPIPRVTWYRILPNKERVELINSTRRIYRNGQTNGNAYLQMEHVSIEDGGLYILNARNNLTEKDLVLQVTVLEKPTVTIQIDDYHMIGKVSVVNCTAAAYPPAEIYWTILPCMNCNQSIIPENETRTEVEGLTRISRLNITAKDNGEITCHARNLLGTHNSTVGFFVTDIENGLNIWKDGDDGPIAKNDSVTLHCGASRVNFTSNISWFTTPNYTEIDLTNNNEQSDDFEITRSSTDLSYKSSLTMHVVTKNTTFVCRFNENSYSQSVYRNYTIIAKDPEEPKIIYHNMENKSLEVNVHEPTELRCFVSGIPKPKVFWYKDNTPLDESERFTFETDNQLLKFKYTKEEDEGTYKCVAKNRLGAAEKEISLKLKNKSGWNIMFMVIIGVLLLLFVIVIAVLGFKVRKEKKLKHELKIAGLANFEKGNVECLNPELGVDDQAELLPYDKKWEFPREKLKLGKQLGSGAFGVVMKAEAHGINDEEQNTVVAVKMVKGNADPTGIKALASELKIMVHLGKHINVVNLLGACTKNVTKRELLVIVEYCRFGNLQNYLLRHRSNFVNQIDPKTGTIDPTMGREALERTFSVNSNTSSSGGGFVIPRNMVDYRVNSNEACVTGNTEMTSICMTPTTEDQPILSNNSVQPEWRSNYTGDYKGHVKPISTSDLVQWAFQVSRGMDYLASRKVLHGDLAARNILLAENNVVKICDFGLAKSMYKSDNYKKKGSGLLPVKWMAVESISDRIFSTQSDVWSFGIVLWEFFSLACTPYPGMEANEILYNKLVEGYRMEQPEYATNEIYQIMSDCWEKKPSNRPVFSELEERLGNILEEGVRKHYISLNDPYLLMNTRRLENHSDYLAMMSPPDYGNLASPTMNHYINQGPSGSGQSPNKVPEDSSGYLCMRPTKAPDIFSPRTLDDENIFNFDLAAAKNLKQKNLNGEAATGVELLPMLNSQNPESDSETSPTERGNTPNSVDSSANCISNPNYYKPPVIMKASASDVDEDGDTEFKGPVINEERNILKGTDNYVNMPKNKSALATKNKSQEILNPSSSPTLLSFKTNPEERHYVNSNARAWDMPMNA